jgi:hypothetical protein
MNTKPWFGFLAGALLTAFAALPIAWAERTVNEKGCVVYHFVEVEAIPASDVAGHVISIMEASGFSFPDTDEGANCAIHDDPGRDGSPRVRPRCTLS